MDALRRGKQLLFHARDSKSLHKESADGGGCRFSTMLPWCLTGGATPESVPGGTMPLQGYRRTRSRRWRYTSSRIHRTEENHREVALDGTRTRSLGCNIFSPTCNTCRAQGVSRERSSWRQYSNRLCTQIKFNNIVKSLALYPGPVCLDNLGYHYRRAHRARYRQHRWPHPQPTVSTRLF